MGKPGICDIIKAKRTKTHFKMEKSITLGLKMSCGIIKIHSAWYKAVKRIHSVKKQVKNPDFKMVSLERAYIFKI